MSRILVAYATKNGSTREVAEAIAATLDNRGVAVDVHPARSIRGSVAGWNLVVVGAPIYSGRWHRDAHRFLKRHRDELRQIPIVVFEMGPRDGAEEAWRRSRSQLDRALAKREWRPPSRPPYSVGSTRRSGPIRPDVTCVIGMQSEPGPPTSRALPDGSRVPWLSRQAVTSLAGCAFALRPGLLPSPRTCPDKHNHNYGRYLLGWSACRPRLQTALPASDPSRPAWSG